MLLLQAEIRYAVASLNLYKVVYWCVYGTDTYIHLLERKKLSRKKVITMGNLVNQYKTF